ncbi:YetF domain-containing protein [Citricoccus zhacaiensis]
MPVVLVENGRPLKDVMDRERISTEDVLSAARSTQGLESMSQIKWAVLETSGSISIVPAQQGS